MRGQGFIVNYGVKLILKQPVVYKKRMARAKISNAIQAGKLKKQSCEIKNCRWIGEAHHDDYDQPLEIRWLCKKHHSEFHSSLRQKERIKP